MKQKKLLKIVTTNDVYQEKQLCFRKIGLVPLPKMIALDKID
jgi:hypothetical protein